MNLRSFPRPAFVIILLVLCSQVQLFAQTIVETDGDFNLYSNGIVKCTAANILDTGLLDGISYTKRTKEQITTANAPTSCTSVITDMNTMFADSTSFNGDISSWDVSNVTDMGFMFSGASSFNSDISNWDVGMVTNMSAMFQVASAFTSDVSNWDVSNVTNMAFMFSDVSSFNSDIGGWDVSKVTDMSSMFQSDTLFNADISNWQVDRVTNMTGMFSGAKIFNADLSSWQVDSVTSINGMFQGATNFNADLSGWNVGKVTDMSFMFYNTPSFNSELNSWDVSSVQDMSFMFSFATSFNRNLNSWDVSSVLNMSYMFDYASNFNGNISNWDVSNVTNMYAMFRGAITFNADIRNWVVSSVTEMTDLFRNTNAFNADISNWDVSSVVTMNGMFRYATAFNQNISNWDVSNVEKMIAMFLSAKIFNQPIGVWDVSGVSDMSYLFYNANNTVFNQDISSWDVSNVTRMYAMFAGVAAFTGDISNWDVSNVTDMSYMFYESKNVSQELGSWDVSNVTLMEGMFESDSTFNGNISNWDVSRVTNMDLMFNSATSFNQDLTNWCVSLIALEPTDFSLGGLISGANKPVWGTCPVVQRVISGDLGWRLLSFPITGGTVEDISDDTPIQGIAGGEDADFAANFYLYDDAGSYEEPTNDSTAFGDGKGFAVYFYDNTSGGSLELPVTLDAVGVEPASDVVVTMNPNANGYTLVGNPFASNFSSDAANMAATGANIQNNIHFWNNGSGSYSTQDRTLPYVVKPWQGFWVQTDAIGGATTLTFSTEGKVDSTANGTFFSKAANNRGDINFTLTSETTFDEAIRIAFRTNATTEYDLDDAGKMAPLIPEYATMAFYRNDLMKSVESLPYDLQEEITIPTYLELVGVNGEFTFAWNGLETIPGEWELILHDYEMETSVNMRQMNEYIFTAGDSVQSKINPITILEAPSIRTLSVDSLENRFGITIRPTSVSNENEDAPLAFTLDQNYPNPFNPSTTINYSINDAGAVNISVYNLMGQKVATLVDENKAAGQYNVRWNAAGVASGMYYYRIEAGGQSITRKMTLIK